ncbi:MAG: tRNA (adenine(37)-N6)-methyltransferase, partial [uncultured Rubrobacteraceae bacterium]
EHRDGSHRVREDGRREGPPQLARFRRRRDTGRRRSVQRGARGHRAEPTHRGHLQLSREPLFLSRLAATDATAPAAGTTKCRQKHGYFQHLLARAAQSHRCIGSGGARGGGQRRACQGPRHERREPNPRHQALPSGRQTLV